MTVPAPQAVAPAAPQTPAPAPANHDTYGDKRISIMDIPVIGQEGQPPAPKAEGNPPAPEPEGQTPAPEVVDGKPVETPEPQPGNTVLKAKNGREFKDQSELLTTYDASSTEAQRLAGEAKTLKITGEDTSNKLKEANATILAMQEYIGNAAYQPNVPEKYKGMNESEMIAQMTDDEKLDYKLDKREWGKKVESFKTQMANAKAESEAIAVRIKAEIDRVESVMSSDKANYPEFTELAPLRNEILKQSPHLANRPDSHYVAYYMAFGIASTREKAESARLTEQSRATAAANAASAAANGGGGAPQTPGKSPAPKDDGLRGLVKAGKALKGAF